MDDWIKLWCIYTMGYCSAIRKDELLPLAITRMDLEGITLSEISQMDKDKNKNHVISLICGISNRKQEMNNRDKLTDTDNRRVVSREEGG